MPSASRRCYWPLNPKGWSFFFILNRNRSENVPQAHMGLSKPSEDNTSTIASLSSPVPWAHIHSFSSVRTHETPQQILALHSLSLQVLVSDLRQWLSSPRNFDQPAPGMFALIRTLTNGEQSISRIMLWKQILNTHHIWYLLAHTARAAMMVFCDEDTGRPWAYSQTISVHFSIRSASGCWAHQCTWLTPGILGSMKQKNIHKGLDHNPSDSTDDY